ncbi:hypothetical protein BGZ60DRAFT_432828 [Tricladium varicosporioides]|nr:hypothetical protein BGZ60DRAFT_432828 [Hymenoscyphus varicosporioides]
MTTAWPQALFWLLRQKLRRRTVHFKNHPGRRSTSPQRASSFSTNGIQPRPETASNLAADTLQLLYNRCSPGCPQNPLVRALGTSRIEFLKYRRRRNYGYIAILVEDQLLGCRMKAAACGIEGSPRSIRSSMDNSSPKHCLGIRARTHMPDRSCEHNGASSNSNSVSSDFVQMLSLCPRAPPCQIQTLTRRWCILLIATFSKQLADSMDSEKTCRILGDLLAARLFESESAAKATFPALFSPRELGNDTALIVKCAEDGFEGECGHRDATNPDAPPFLDILRSPDTPMPNSASPKVGAHQKAYPSHDKTHRGHTSSGEGKAAVPKEVFHEDREKNKQGLKRTRDCDIISTNPTYLPFRLQHLVLTQTQRLLEECCYNFAEKWFPSMLEANGWEAPEAVELTESWPVAGSLLQARRIYPALRCSSSPTHSCQETLRDDLRAAQLLHWHKELEGLVAHLQLRTNSQREAAEAELRNIHNTKVEIEERLAELESRASQLTQSLKAEGRTHRPIDIEALRSLEEALSRPALAKALPVITQDQVWQWIDNGVGMIIDLKYARAPKRLTVKVEPPGTGPRDQPLLRAPVLAANALHDSYESFYGYMGERDSLHKRRKCSREADETEHEVFQRSIQDSRVTTRSMTLRRTAVEGYESFRLTPDMQTRAENETAGHVLPGVKIGLQSASAEQLQPSMLTRYPPDPVSTDDDDESTDYGTVPSDYEWE